MRAAAYCRVSTKREEQLDSLESQEKFFLEYAKKNGYELVHIYADEGKSGTKMKNRTQLLQLMQDASQGEFELVLIKDISRLARNTVDFLTSIRKMRAWGIKVIFVNYDQTSSESSEFMLTMLSAIAQEESANTSKRVKFGKKQNARLGRVPNLIFGYDKIPGEYFDLRINEKEAETVRRIFRLYTREKMGASRIAEVLNEEMIRTKRGCSWSQASICRLLGNEIYIGNIINGKEEIEDFLTGRRKVIQKDDWCITCKPELRIVDADIFKKAQDIREKRSAMQKEHKGRDSSKHPLSQLIICKHCGGYFRRLVRNYRSTVITWVCGTRNKKGAASCGNNISVNEEEVLTFLHGYFGSILREFPSVMNALVKNSDTLSLSLSCRELQDLKREIGKKERERKRYIELFASEIISLEELKEQTVRLAEETNLLRVQLKKKEETKAESCSGDIMADEKSRIDYYVAQTFTDNLNLKRILDRIEADAKGNIGIYLKSLPLKGK